MEKWGFREAARHLQCSWKLIQKEAEGVLASYVLPKDAWVHEPVTMFRQHFALNDFGRMVWTHQTEEPSEKPVLKCFDAARLRELATEEFQHLLTARWLDEHDSDVFAFFGAGEFSAPNIMPALRTLRLHQWLNEQGVTPASLNRWLSADTARQDRWDRLNADVLGAQKAWDEREAAQQQKVAKAKEAMRESRAAQSERQQAHKTDQVAAPELSEEA